jgi:hypothetical protein
MHGFLRHADRGDVLTFAPERPAGTFYCARLSPTPPAVSSKSPTATRKPCSTNRSAANASQPPRINNQRPPIPVP